MGITLLLLVVLIAAFVGGTFVAVFTRLASLKGAVERLEREREEDRELLEAVLLEDTGKIRRIMGRG